MIPDGDAIDVTITAEEAGQRLDRVLAARITALSRARLQALIRLGHVSDGSATATNARRPVKPGEAYRVTVPPAADDAAEAQAMPLKIVFEDDAIIVIDKPAGIVVHPAAGHASGTLVNALIAHCGHSLSGIGGVRRPGIVHRLDKDTSGLLVVAKTDAAHQALQEQFQSHGRDGRLQRTYMALVWGVLERQRGTVDANLVRSAANRKKIAVTRGDGGRHAVTHYEVTEVFADTSGKPAASMLRLALETGRTHQIRVHLAHIGHPVLGDLVYGAGFKASAHKLNPAAQQQLRRLGRQALHAAELGFIHPMTSKKMLFASALPPDIDCLVRALRGEEPTLS